MIQNQDDFDNWLNSQLQENIPSNIIAYNINVYESPFKVELVGSSEFTPDNEDWACNEDWVPDNRQNDVSISLFGTSWEEAEKTILNMASSYFESNQSNVAKLKDAKAFSVGFVDGNLNYVVGN